MSNEIKEKNMTVIGKKRFDPEHPIIMGILNVTPDSFSDGGLFFDTDKAVQQIEKMVEEGVDIIDIGAESSRPGADVVSAEVEIERLKPILEICQKRFPNLFVSVDTVKSTVAKMACDYGVSMINDISGLNTDPEIAAVVSNYSISLAIMHMQGTPQTMQTNPYYKNVVTDIKISLQKSILVAKKYNVTNLVIDPGIGFGKTLAHNLSLLNHVDSFLELGYPVLIGASRKSFIEKITKDPVDQRLPGTIAANVMCYTKGGRLFRVHDVSENRRALEIAKQIKLAT